VDYIVVILVFLFILLFGGKISKLTSYRRIMVASMIPASVIGLICFAGFALSLLQVKYVIGGIVNGIYVFCLSSMGIAFARNVTGFEPFPVFKSFLKRENRIRQVLMMLFLSIILAALIDVVGFFILKACLFIFSEPDKSALAISSLPTKNKFLAFPLLLAGAGIAEEVMFRLFIQSFIWKLFKNSWVAIVLSSLCFALYHLSPMDSMYKIYWNYPLAQFTTVFITGLIVGYFYKKRGFETVVLGHTIADYIGVLSL